MFYCTQQNTLIPIENEWDLNRKRTGVLFCCNASPLAKRVLCWVIVSSLAILGAMATAHAQYTSFVGYWIISLVCLACIYTRAAVQIQAKRTFSSNGEIQSSCKFKQGGKQIGVESDTLVFSRSGLSVATTSANSCSSSPSRVTVKLISVACACISGL